MTEQDRAAASVLSEGVHSRFHSRIKCRMMLLVQKQTF